MARKYFGTDAPLGETLTVEKKIALRVTAVFEDLPGNSHLNFRIVASGKAPLSLHFADSLADDDNRPINTHTYFGLKPGTDIRRVRARLPDFLRSHWSAEDAKAMRLIAIPIADIHLSPPGRGSMKPRGNPVTLRALTLVGALIVLIAVINFVNLSLARVAQRSVEVGIRKLAGARHRDLWIQLSAESLLYVAFAMLTAISLVELALPTFCALVDLGADLFATPSITFHYWRDGALAGAIAVTTLSVSLLASAYPSLVLSRLRPAAVLKGAFLGNAGARQRRLLVIAQFALLIGLIFATSVIYRQTNYALNAALRIDTEHVVIFNLWSNPAVPGRAAQTFFDEVPKIPGVRGITSSNALPTNSQMVTLPFGAESQIAVQIQIAVTDYNFFDFYRVPLIAGRTLSPEMATDHYEYAHSARPLSVVLNETAARKLGFADPADAVGKVVRPLYWPSNFPPVPTPITIVGVTADFPDGSIRRPIEPKLYFMLDSALSVISIRISGVDVPATMAALDQAWKRFGQPRVQQGWLLEQHYRGLYADIILQRKTLTLFAGCAIFLGMLGLLGLSAYTVQRRVKEIGVRKSLGASTGDILRLLLWAFSKPVLWASVLAWPLTAWLMHRWLQGFVYRVDLGWWWLPAATIAALVVALITVAAHSIVAARSRPVASLRYE
jgi:putative ABC transport system permease protein